MKKIYIVLTHTGTVLSKIVRFYTGKEFSHVSISLDKELNEMYSFGRYNAYNPFFAGFVQESPNSGTFKRFKNTTSTIYCLEIEKKQYNLIKKLIEEMRDGKERYSFNMLGVIAVLVNKHLDRKRKFYCAEFVKYLFENSKLNYDLPEVVKPEDFAKLDGMKEIYTGLLREYKY